MIKLQLHPDRRTLSQFAWISPLGFALLAMLLHRTFGLPAPFAYAFAGIGPLVLVAHLVGARAPVLAAWRALIVVTYPIGFVVFPVVIALVWFGVFTPIGLFFRAIGRDALCLRPDRSRDSYWHERGPARSADSYFRQY